MFLGSKPPYAFGTWVLQHPKFRSGEFDTGFIATYFSSGKHALQETTEEEKEIASLLAAKLANQ
jgi:acetyl/propionyl-CoA carboxylase alpha subunit